MYTLIRSCLPLEEINFFLSVFFEIAQKKNCQTNKYLNLSKKEVNSRRKKNFSKEKCGERLY